MTSGVLAPSGTTATTRAAAGRPAPDVLESLGVDLAHGLSPEEVERRRTAYGPNAVATHHARVLPVLWHQLNSPLLGLLLVAAAASYFVGERSDAVIIGIIVLVSVGLGFVNEYRAEKTAASLHSQVSHEAVVLRSGAFTRVPVTTLVPGDVVELGRGDVVPADIRLTSVVGLECDESVLTGESQPVDKGTDPVAPGATLAELSGCALMGTIVHAGNGAGVVVATGPRTEFGAIAAGLNTHQLDTEFQVGLRRFSMLLVKVAGALTGTVFVVNVVMHKPFLDALLFSLAIAVGITPQLLPAVVSTSLAAGSRQLSRRKVLVKRLVCIEDLGDIDLLFTDKTGTLTAGRIDYARAVPVAGQRSEDVIRWGLLCTERVTSGAGAVAANPLDEALWESPATQAARASLDGDEVLGLLPFDHERRMVSVVARLHDNALRLVTKGAPETVLERCLDVSPETRAALAAEFAAGNRVVAVASRPVDVERAPHPADERDLRLHGLLVFLDPPKPDAAEALGRLSALGVQVKVVTGDNAEVAAKVCRDLGLPGDAVLTGTDLGALDDEHLIDAVTATTVFARVSPEDKARIVRAHRHGGGGVAFMGDGVNDALALHAADVGISVDSGTDVAKDAADVILLEKSLDVLADGVVEGRRIFANTLKYVLMGTSSNFGNMASAAGASLVLPFLPMLPSQILLGNLLYDTGQLAIPTDEVDEEQLRRPSHWDIAFIRRFMLLFGPLSSVFDFITFGVMLWGFHAGPDLFRSGWFVESLATQTLVVFAIRTRTVPFFRSRPSLPLTLAALTVVAVAVVIPLTPLAGPLGFAPLPGDFFAALVVMVLAYLGLVELGKLWFYRPAAPPREGAPSSLANRFLRRRAARFSVGVPDARPLKQAQARAPRPQGGNGAGRA